MFRVKCTILISLIIIVALFFIILYNPVFAARKPYDPVAWYIKCRNVNKPNCIWPKVDPWYDNCDECMGWSSGKCGHVNKSMHKTRWCLYPPYIDLKDHAWCGGNSGCTNYHPDVHIGLGKTDDACTRVGDCATFRECIQVAPGPIWSPPICGICEYDWQCKGSNFCKVAYTTCTCATKAAESQPITACWGPGDCIPPVPSKYCKSGPQWEVCYGGWFKTGSEYNAGALEDGACYCRIDD